VAWKVDPSVKLWERHVQGINNVYRELKLRGTGELCWVMSEDRRMDARELDLRTALEEVVGRGIGTLLSSIPGRLAYFEGEDERLLLARQI
jgi:hypothetical protein